MYLMIPAASPDPYRQLKSLSFAPEVDLTLASVPVNEFRCEIVTEDAISAGGEAMLYDDMDRLWADYVITKCDRIDRKTVSIVAQSPLTYLDRWTMPAEMFQSVTVPDFVDALLNSVPKSGYMYHVDVDVDSYFNYVRVTGFCPEQTARERLQWLCLTVGAIVNQCFSSSLEIVPSPDVANTGMAGTLIPISDTYMKPSIETKDIVKAVTITGYGGFTSTEPVPSDTWESGEDDGGVTWWFLPEEWTIENEDASTNPGQTYSIEGVTLLSGNATRARMSQLATAYFRPGEITLECINNAQYKPGDKVRVYTDEETVYAGFIQSCDFSFGTQTKARLTISSDLLPVLMGKLTANYLIPDNPTHRNIYGLPIGEQYSITFPNIIIPCSIPPGHNNSFRVYSTPNSRASGIIQSASDSVDRQYELHGWPVEAPKAYDYIKDYGGSLIHPIGMYYNISSAVIGTNDGHGDPVKYNKYVLYVPDEVIEFGIHKAAISKLNAQNGEIRYIIYYTLKGYADKGWIPKIIHRWRNDKEWEGIHGMIAGNFEIKNNKYYVSAPLYISDYPYPFAPGKDMAIKYMLSVVPMNCEYFRTKEEALAYVLDE